MAYYDFKRDLKVAKKTEKEVANILAEKYNAEILGFGDKSGYDILTEIDKVVRRFEIKEDFMCKKTGNVALEFSCRGKDSGIVVSKADYFIYKIHTKDGIIFIMHKTSDLRKMVKDKKYFKIVNGGDKGSNSLSYLFKLNVFKQYGYDITPAA